MDVEQIRASFRSPSPDDYPELRGYSRDQIYEAKMGPGGLYLAAQMSRRMALSPGQRVLDLGCGGGATSVFLAKEFGVRVVAVDLWLTATEKRERFQRHGVDEFVMPLNLDITRELPFAEEYFDAVFCMDSVHYYGTSSGFWGHLLPHVTSGGTVCIGSPCFGSEFTPEALSDLPIEYDDGSDLWPTEFARYHSPGWWERHLSDTGLLEVLESAELEDGVIYWEDDVLHNLDLGKSVEGEEKDADQVRYRREGMPYLTHFLLYARRLKV